MMGTEGERNLTVVEVAARVGLSPGTVQRAIRNGYLRASRVGERRYAVREGDFIAWVVTGTHTGGSERKGQAEQ